MLQFLTRVVESLGRHITQSCKLCGARGFFCEFCRASHPQRRPIYAFEIVTAVQCDGCMAFFHRKYAVPYSVAVACCPHLLLHNPRDCVLACCRAAGATCLGSAPSAGASRRGELRWPASASTPARTPHSPCPRGSGHARMARR